MVIRVVTLLPLIAAIASGYLVWLAVTSETWRTRTTRMFAVLNVSIVAWSAAYFFQLNFLPGVEPSLAAPGTTAFAVFCIITAGIAGAPTYWFLFAASFAGSRFWTGRLGMWLANVPLIYTMLVVITNPWHRLFVTASSSSTGFSYGPLALPHQIMTFVLVAAGIWTLTRALWRKGTVRARHQAAVVFIVSMLPALGGIAWGTRTLTGLPLTVNPTPLAFAVLSASLGYLVAKSGLGDIVPVAANQAFRTIADGIVVIDQSGLVAALNPAAERLLPQAEIGAPACDALPEGWRLTEARRAGSDFAEYEAPLDDGTYWIRIRRTRDRAHVPIGQVVFLTDITELRATQNELARLNDRLRLHVTALEEAHRETERRRFALERANWELRVATQAKSRFLANMSHELRTPLNSIIGFTGVMLQGLAGDLNEEQRHQLEMANHSGRHLLRLINDILDLSKVESGAHDMRPSRVIVDDLVESVAGTIAPLVAEKALTLRVENLAQGMELMTDPVRVRQVLLNLLGNAVKFTDAGVIMLGVEKTADAMSFSVRDEGIGIQEHELPRIFNPFEQIAGDAGVKPEGTGLGLSISREIAHALGGTLTASSEPGAGSLFTLSLPLDYPQQSRRARTAEDAS